MHDPWETLPDYLTVEQVAQKLQVSRSHVYRLIKDGIIPATRFGEGDKSPLRILKSDLIAYLQKQA